MDSSTVCLGEGDRERAWLGLLTGVFTMYP